MTDLLRVRDLHVEFRVAEGVIRAVRGISFRVRPGSTVATGAAVLLAGLLSLVAAAILALAEVLDPWLAALIVALVYAAVAAGLALLGRQKTREAIPPAPEQAIESTKEDVQWAKSRVKSARR